MLVSFLAVACGSGSTGSPGGSGLDTTTLLKQLRSVQKGEVLIIGKRPVRFSGPYSFRRGGYVFHFTQAARADGSRPQLRVSLESHRGSRKPPYLRLVDTNRLGGRVSMTISGRLFVHVITSSPSYLLRFTPRTLDH
jgi:hypothetical protein